MLDQSEIFINQPLLEYDTRDERKWKTAVNRHKHDFGSVDKERATEGVNTGGFRHFHIKCLSKRMLVVL